MNNKKKHDIEEMAKGQIGLQWPRPTWAEVTYYLTSIKQFFFNDDEALAKYKTKYQSESRVVFSYRTWFKHISKVFYGFAVFKF